MPVIQPQLHSLLSHAFSPSHLEVINESHGHGGYYEGKESHFKVVIVSQAFETKRAVARHQAVYAACAAPMQARIHALAIHCYTPSEWDGQSPDSPACAATKKPASI